MKNIRFFALLSLEDFQEITGNIKGNPFDSEEKKVDLKGDLIAKMKRYRPSGVSVSKIVHKIFILYFYIFSPDGI